MFKAGLIGCGNIGSIYDEKKDSKTTFTHAGMYSKTEVFQLTCAAELDPERRRAFENFWKPKSMYANHLDLLAHERLDIISIATPDHTHEKIIRDVLTQAPPKLIFTEKPIAESMEAACQIATLCRQTRTSIVVDYIRRWDRRHQAVNAFLKAGGLGEIQGITGYYVRGIRHNGCQMINLLRYFFGSIRTVRTYGCSSAGSIQGDPSLSCIFTFENGDCANVTALDTKGYGFSIFELDIFGKTGRLRISDGGQVINLYLPEQDSQFSNFKKLHLRESPWGDASYGDAMIRAGQDLSSLLIDTSPPTTNSLTDAIQDLQVIESAIESANNNHKETDIHISKENDND